MFAWRKSPIRKLSEGGAVLSLYTALLAVSGLGCSDGDTINPNGRWQLDQTITISQCPQAAVGTKSGDQYVIRLTGSKIRLLGDGVDLEGDLANDTVTLRDESRSMTLLFQTDGLTGHGEVTGACPVEFDVVGTKLSDDDTFATKTPKEQDSQAAEPVELPPIENLVEAPTLQDFAGVWAVVSTVDGSACPEPKYTTRQTVEIKLDNGGVMITATVPTIDALVYSSVAEFNGDSLTWEAEYVTGSATVTSSIKVSIDEQGRLLGPGTYRYHDPEDLTETCEGPMVIEGDRE